MEELIDNIKSIVKELDKGEDALLIGLLEEKLTNKINTKLSAIGINKSERSHSLIGIKNVIRRHFRKEIGFRIEDFPYRIKKADRIYEDFYKNLCVECKFNESPERFSYIDGNYCECSRCRNCKQRIGVFGRIVEDYKEDYLKRLEDSVITEDFIELKCIINKIRKKLEDYETS